MNSRQTEPFDSGFVLLSTLGRGGSNAPGLSQNNNNMIPPREEKTLSERVKPVVNMDNPSKALLKNAALKGVTVVSTVGTRGRKKKNKSSKMSYKMWNTTAQPWPERIAPTLDNAPYKFIQTYTALNSFSTSTTVESFQSYNFTVAALPNISPLTALFDQYRITKVEFWIVPQSNVGTDTGEMLIVTDYDDSSNLASYNAGLEYQDCQYGNLALGFYRSFVPHAAVAAYSGTFTSYANVASPWIDAASTSVQHYGVKVASTVTGTILAHDAYIRLHTEWRNVR